MKLVPVTHLHENCTFGGWCKHLASGAIMKDDKLIYRCTGHRGKIETSEQLFPVITEVVRKVEYEPKNGAV